jgi:outer membrane lipoprotein carrier protein
MNPINPARLAGLYCALCFALIALLAASRAANAGDPVADYFAGLNSFQSAFVQTVVDSDGEQLQHSEGTVWIQRPGKFRWDYRTPYRQLVVADGEKLWTYDEDLEQATIKPIDEALSSTPAMLLSGFRPLSEVMSWRQVDGDDDGLEWYRLDPKQVDAAVEKVRIGFENDQLVIIDVVDGFGNYTRIRFSRMVRNQAIDAGLFELKLPPGTDVIGE